MNRLPNSLMQAFHGACDDGELDTARSILGTLETMLNRRPFEAPQIRRKNLEAFVAACERLWHLRNGAVEMREAA